VSSERLWLGGGIAFLLLVTLAIFAFVGKEEVDGAEAAPVVVCVDSTLSTEDVREDYLPDLEEVAKAAAGRQASFYAAGCGKNATGDVNWPVHQRFDPGSYEGELGDDVTKGQLEEVNQGLDEIVNEKSRRDGTPLGEMLAVAARQCDQAGGECAIYLFTDGEWADDILHLPREGISKAAADRYLDTYEGQIGDLSGTVVHFVGVGYGTEIGEIRLNEARKIAADLIEAAEGEMGTWAVRL
jgi:hypothetical protein